MFKKLKISCNKATTICNKAQYKEASLIEKIQLYTHLIACEICSRYSKQNTKMSHIFKMNANICNNEMLCLSSKEKEKLKKELAILKKSTN
ncbi:hypothetical protein [Tenacibaculum piscium]|uniref:hypothetical protein n=1 Tax=Tenacibaculum piscium TaxID=1458515 RepID=UPI001F27312D|nr:hypothetical protein [Tenacibaculum piscium]